MFWQYAANPLSKLKTVAEAQSLVAAERRDGRLTVFANGCFDLIHVGHIRYLEGARAQGDLLVVAVNSDASVRALKGPHRPLQTAADRAEIICSLACVDYAVIFDELTVAGLLLQLRPDIHAKGTDYTPQSVPERETVRSYGGRIAIVGDPKEHSSRDLIQHILANFHS